MVLSTVPENVFHEQQDSNVLDMEMDDCSFKFFNHFSLKTMGSDYLFFVFSGKVIIFFNNFWRQKIIKKNILPKMEWSIPKIVLSSSRH